MSNNQTEKREQSTKDIFLFQISNQAGKECYVVSEEIIAAQEKARRHFVEIAGPLEMETIPNYALEPKKIVLLGKQSNLDNKVFHYPGKEKE